MKKNLLLVSLFLFSVLLLTGCGGNKKGIGSLMGNDNGGSSYNGSGYTQQEEVKSTHEQIVCEKDDYLSDVTFHDTFYVTLDKQGYVYIISINEKATVNSSVYYSLQNRSSAMESYKNRMESNIKNSYLDGIETRNYNIGSSIDENVITTFVTVYFQDQFSDKVPKSDFIRARENNGYSCRVETVND